MCIFFLPLHRIAPPFQKSKLNGFNDQGITKLSPEDPRDFDSFTKKAVMPKKKVITARNLKDWNQFLLKRKRKKKVQFKIKSWRLDFPAHPSHSQTARLLPSSMSLGITVPRVT